MTQLESTRRRRLRYLEWVEEQIEEFKGSTPRSDLLRIADEAVDDLQGRRRAARPITEALLCEAVDHRIFRLLGLPGYSTWRTGRSAERSPAGEIAAPVPEPAS